MESFFSFDLEDCKIYENSILLGIVDEVQRIGSTNYLIVKTDEKLIKAGDAKSFLIPFHPPFILHTDIETKTITTDGAFDILKAS